MSITALTGLVREWYTPKEEQDEKIDKCEFHLAPLTAPQMAQVQTHYDLEKGIQATGLYLACEFGIVGWKNFLDHEGAQLKFSKKKLEFLPLELVAELGGQIIEKSILSGDDEKNS